MGAYVQMSTRHRTDPRSWILDRFCVGLREGYTVRSASGYRYTTYVPYSLATFSGNWSGPVGDEELYDYNTDRWVGLALSLALSSCAIQPVPLSSPCPCASPERPLCPRPARRPRHPRSLS